MSTTNNNASIDVDPRNTVVIIQTAGKSLYVKTLPELKKNLSVAKLLGGKENVRSSKWWTKHGGGGWITDRYIKNLTKAIESITSYGYDALVYFYDNNRKKR